MALNMMRKRRLVDLYRTIVVETDGTVHRSDGKAFSNLETAVPRGWVVEELGDALDREPVTVNQSKLRRSEKRARTYVQRIVEYPTEYVAYDPNRVRCGFNGEDPRGPGSRAVGCYGERFVALTH